jgi:manganese oxidase
VASSLNSSIDSSQPMPLRFAAEMPIQFPNKVWTFNGTIPPKLVLGRYGKAILCRHHNGLPPQVDTGAYFFPGQFYDYHWPIVLAGHFSMNTGANDFNASTPDGSGGLIPVPGDWHETMSTHWFHDHMFSFTSQNVYKGNAAMFNIYSGLDRGNESIRDGVNLRFRRRTA